MDLALSQDKWSKKDYMRGRVKKRGIEATDSSSKFKVSPGVKASDF